MADRSYAAVLGRRAAILQDATGVEATVNGTTLELVSSLYGSDAFVDIQLIDEAAGGTIRTAIGATRLNLVTQLLTESLGLAIIGGSVGLLLAWGLTRVVASADPLQWPWAADVRLDIVVLAFAAAVTVATGVLFGILPALYASKTDPHTGLREGGRTGADGRTCLHLLSGPGKAGAY